jgi:methionyl-tRNA synthetase
VTPQELCAKYHALHRDIYDWFRLDFDHFGRTPTPHHTDIVQDIFKDLWNNGYIEERETSQPFCPVETHNSFLADRFVEGECSICHDKGARGDQCDACGSSLDPLEPLQDEASSQEAGATGWLINPRCKIDGATPERRKTKHLYLRLNALQDKVAAWFNEASKSGAWSSSALAITQSWLDKGFQPRAISRDLKWGVPIPKVEGINDEEYAKKVFYVWFDACIGYISITKSYTDEWQKWWFDPENVKLYQFLGKDNVQFHSCVFPASQIGTGKEYTKVHRISATEYLNYENGKFSKSRGVGVFGNNAKDTGIDPDIWRFYLLSKRPETADSEFKWEEFIDTNNNELLKNIGNLIQRTLKFCAAKLASIVPRGDEYTDEIIDNHKKEARESLATYLEHLEATKLRAGVSDILAFSSLGNKFLQDNKLDGRLLTEQPARCHAVISVALSHIHLLASIIFPYMPGVSEGIFKQLGLRPEPKIPDPDTWNFDSVPAGHVIGIPEPLFKQIPAAKLDEWKDAYGGEELKRQKALAAEKAAAKKAKKQQQKEKKQQQKQQQKETAPAAPSAATGVESDVAKLSIDEKKN